jgi:hypothetical protein
MAGIMEPLVQLALSQACRWELLLKVRVPLATSDEALAVAARKEATRRTFMASFFGIVVHRVAADHKVVSLYGTGVFFIETRTVRNQRTRELHAFTDCYAADSMAQALSRSGDDHVLLAADWMVMKHYHRGDLWSSYV